VGKQWEAVVGKLNVLVHLVDGIESVALDFDPSVRSGHRDVRFIGSVIAVSGLGISDPEPFIVWISSISLQPDGSSKVRVHWSATADAMKEAEAHNASRYGATCIGCGDRNDFIESSDSYRCYSCRRFA
jgi:hypothetical protein